MRLFHFSEDPGIERFAPRAVRTAAARAAGKEWLNGPLVWAIDEVHQPMYLFPRDCPRILLWPTARTAEDDRRRIWGTCSSRMIAYVERRWMASLHETVLYRYELPPVSFEGLDDTGMWVSKLDVRPMALDRIDDLPAALHREDVEVRFVDDLTPLRGLWSTSLHVSGIRLRNAVGWVKQASQMPGERM